MGVLAWSQIGLIAGWLAAKITNAPRGLLRNLIIGLIGSLFGGSFFPSSACVLCPISGAN
jgi:uncharacterized membrane protein YeaQ/YmgE (transglycosylase-associated protein family)